MRRIVTRLVVGMAITAIGMFGADSSVGTWKWNAAKSKSNTSNPLKNRTDVVEATPDGGVKVTRTELRSDGTTHNSSYTYKYDSKEYPVTGQQFDTISAKRIDENTTVAMVKKTGGAYNQTTKNIFSKDGKTKAAATTGTDSAGKPITSNYVYDKQ